MKDFITSYTALIAPILVAIVSGGFYLIKKGGNNQTVSNNRGNVTMINGNNNHVGEK